MKLFKTAICILVITFMAGCAAEPVIGVPVAPAIPAGVT
jgi:hypothetical protein